MNAQNYKKNFDDHEVEEKIFRDGSQLFCSCVAYDVVSEASIGESLGATEEFQTFIHALIKAGEGKNFIARENALKRLVGRK